MSLAFAHRHHAKRAMRQAGFALAILALHGAMGYVLLSPELWRVWSKQSAAEKITWLELAQPQVEQPKIRSDEPVPRPQPQRLKRASAKPSVQPPPPVDSSISSPQDPGLRALRSYVWCGALDDGKQWTGQQTHCDKVKWGLQTAALPKRVPTEREKDLTRQFEHDLAFDKAPKLIPCVYGMINIICLAEGVMNGFDFKMGSYGDIKPAKTNCTSRFDGEACARVYSLNSASPTAVHR